MLPDLQTQLGRRAFAREQHFECLSLMKVKTLANNRFVSIYEFSLNDSYNNLQRGERFKVTHSALPSAFCDRSLSFVKEKLLSSPLRCLRFLQTSRPIEGFQEQQRAPSLLLQALRRDARRRAPARVPREDRRPFR